MLDVGRVGGEDKGESGGESIEAERNEVRGLIEHA